MAVLSEYLFRDIGDGEITGPFELYVHEGTPWAIVAVCEPEGTDLFRAYPPENYVNKFGLICVSGPNIEKLKASIRNDR